jgi:hypothetical protein
MSAFSYDTFIQRNNGYITSSVQDRIREARVLFAGCGLGSGPVICAARAGFQHFVLIDGDTVDAHNLNRQFFDFDDIGTPKVEALKKHILRINPDAKVEAVHANVDQANAQALVDRVDIIFDTIDFLDLEAILSLHCAAKKQVKPAFTALSIGYGAGVLYFPASLNTSLADIVSADVRDAHGDGDDSYAAVFAKIMARIGSHLDRQVVDQVAKALTIMEDGRPCPASQISIGSFTVGAMAVSMMHDMLAGMDVPTAPNMVTHSFRNHCTKLIDISK